MIFEKLIESHMQRHATRKENNLNGPTNSVRKRLSEFAE